MAEVFNHKEKELNGGGVYTTRRISFLAEVFKPQI